MTPTLPGTLGIDFGTSNSAVSWSEGGALARLAAAGRLIVLVLDRTQAPGTFFQRSVASHLQRLQGIPEAVAELAALVKAAVARLDSRLAVSMRAIESADLVLVVVVILAVMGRL